MMASAILAFALAMSINDIDRTSIFSAEYKQCDFSSNAEVEKSYCLSDELKRQRIAMNAALRAQQKTLGHMDAELAKSQKTMGTISFVRLRP